jgi:hypothetical protein
MIAASSRRRNFSVAVLVTLVFVIAFYYHSYTDDVRDRLSYFRASLTCYRLELTLKCY